MPYGSYSLLVLLFFSFFLSKGGILACKDDIFQPVSIKEEWLINYEDHSIK